jgi:hypothetical protein
MAAALFIASAPIYAASKTWNGTISDSMCGAKHPAGEHDGQKMSAADCTKACVDKGAKFVFVSSGKVYDIANQDFEGLKDHAGNQVALTGEMTGDSITVSKIEAKPAKSMKK